MNVHVTYKLHKTPHIETEIAHQIEKLQKRLQIFRPDLIHLKAALADNSPREGAIVHLNLRLPSGQLAAEAKAPNPTAAIKAAFDELTHQLARHKDLLRARHKWRHWRAGAAGSAPSGIPFEQTLAAIHPPTVSADDIGLYVNANLHRLQRFIDRELFFRRSEDTPADLPTDARLLDFPGNDDPGNDDDPSMSNDPTSNDNDARSPAHLSTAEVVNEVIARALADIESPDPGNIAHARSPHAPPEKLALEPWLYRLARTAMDEMSARLRELNSPSHLHLESSRRRQNVQASDEPALQFHQPDEDWTRESSIPDRRISTPEQAAYSDEIIALVQTALRAAHPADREAFLLFAIEGFTPAEIAAITGQPLQSVRDSLQRARNHLRHQPAIVTEFHSRPA